MSDADTNTPSGPTGPQVPPSLSPFMRLIAAVCLGECRERAATLEAFSRPPPGRPLDTEELCRLRAEIEAMQAMRAAIERVITTGRPEIDLSLAVTAFPTPAANSGDPVPGQQVGREAHQARIELLSLQLGVLEQAGFRVDRGYRLDAGSSPNRTHKPTA